MKVDRYKGFIAEHITPINGGNTIRLYGTGNNNNQNAKLYVNGTSTLTIFQRGITIFVLDENLVYQNHWNYDVFGNPSQADAAASRLQNIPSRHFFGIISYDAIGTSASLDSQMSSMNSNLWAVWQQFPENDGSGNLLAERVPFAAFGTKDLGVTHEKIGDPSPGASLDIAAIFLHIRDYDSFDAMGYGSNLINQNTFYHPSTNNTNRSASIPLNSVNHSQKAKLEVNGKISRTGISDGKNVRLVIAENGVEISSSEININNNVFTREKVYFDINSGNSYDLYIQSSNDTEVVLNNLSVRLSGIDPSYSSNSKVKVFGDQDILGGLDIIKSRLSVDIGDINKLLPLYNNSLGNFNLTQTALLHNVMVDSENTTDIESDFIPVSSNIDYVFSTWLKGSTTGNIEIYVTTYDSNQNLINHATINSGNQNNTKIKDLSIGDYIGYEEFVIASKYATSSDLNTLQQTYFRKYDDNGYGLYPNGVQDPNEVIKLNDNISYIKIRVISSNSFDIMIPLVQQLKYGFNNNGEILGTYEETNTVVDERYLTNKDYFYQYYISLIPQLNGPDNLTTSQNYTYTISNYDNEFNYKIFVNDGEITNINSDEFSLVTPNTNPNESILFIIILVDGFPFVFQRTLLADPQITLSGPNSVESGNSYTYIIGNYNPNYSYNISTTQGTVSRSGDTITLNTPNTIPFNDTLTVEVSRIGSTANKTSSMLADPQITLSGPDPIVSKSTYQYTIGNYNPYYSYNISSDKGTTVSRSGDIITLTTPDINPYNEQVSLNVSRTGSSETLSITFLDDPELNIIGTNSVESDSIYQFTVENYDPNYGYLNYSISASHGIAYLQSDGTIDYESPNTIPYSDTATITVSRDGSTASKNINLLEDPQITLSGPNTVQINSTYQYTIGNYNPNYSYNISTTHGFVSRSGDTITLNTPNTNSSDTTLTITVSRTNSTVNKNILFEGESSYVIVTQGNGIYKINSAGSQVWYYDASVHSSNDIAAISMDSNEYIYFSLNTSHVYKLSPTGSLLWIYNDPYEVDAIAGMNTGAVASNFHPSEPNKYIKTISSSGNLLNTFQTATYNTGYAAPKMAVDSNNNIYAYMYGNDFGEDSLYVKFDSNFNILWTKVFPDAAGAIHSVAIDNNNDSYLLLGYDIGVNDSHIVKLDSNGNIIYDKVVNDDLRDLTTDINNNVYTLAATYNGGSGDLYKYDSNGVLQYRTTIISDPDTLAGHVSTDIDGYIYVSYKNNTVSSYSRLTPSGSFEWSIGLLGPSFRMFVLGKGGYPIFW